jgi:predicted hydrocarbon binding protein
MATNRDIRIPADSVHDLRRTLVREVGADAAARALQEAGHAAGDALFERLTRNGGADPGDTPSASFWDRLAGLFRELNWGTLSHEEMHPGVGALVARGWFEVDPTLPRPRCPFTTGMLANILGRIAGQDVAVFQVDCDGDETGCARFLFGSGQVLNEIYSGLLEGRDLETALSTLGA